MLGRPQSEDEAIINPPLLPRHIALSTTHGPSGLMVVYCLVFVHFVGGCGGRFYSKIVGGCGVEGDRGVVSVSAVLHGLFFSSFVSCTRYFIWLLRANIWGCRSKGGGERTCRTTTKQWLLQHPGRCSGYVTGGLLSPHHHHHYWIETPFLLYFLEPKPFGYFRRLPVLTGFTALFPL